MAYERFIVLVLAVAAALLITRVPIMLRARRLKGKVLERLAAVLPADIDPAGPLLLYFWSPSCGMCRSTTPLINELQQERSDVVSINAAEHLELAREAGIMGTPAFVVVNHGAIQQLLMGARNRRQIETLLASD